MMPLWCRILSIAPILATVTSTSLAQVKEAPKPMPLTARAEAANEFRTGLQAYANWEGISARDHMKRALELDPTFATARAYLARFDRDQRTALVEQAMRDVTNATAPEVLLVLAFRESANGRTANVAPLFELASRLAPDDPLIANEHAMLLAGKPRIEALRTVAQRFPDFAPARASLAYYLTQPYTKIPEADREEALHAAQEAVRLEPANATTVTALAHVLQRSGKIPEADEQLAAALKLPAGSYYTHFLAAQISASKGRFAEARQFIARAQDLNPFPANRSYYERATALTFARERNLKAATAALQSSAERDEAAGFKQPATVNHVFCALLLAGVGDQTAVQHIEHAKRIGGMPASWIAMDEAFTQALLGNSAAARTALEQYTKSFTEATAGVEGRAAVVHSITGMILLAEGKSDQAVAEFKQGENTPWSMFGLAEAYDKLGMKKEMQAQRAAYLAMPDPGLSDASVLPIALNRWKVRLGSN